METKKIEKISYDEMYVAMDGMEFVDRDCCIKYEKTLACALRTKLIPMTLKKSSEYGILDTGSDDNEMYVLLPKTPDDIVTIRQVAIGLNTGYNFDHVTDDMIGKVVLLTIGYDNEWVSVTTLDAIVECATGGKFSLAAK